MRRHFAVLLSGLIVAAGFLASATPAAASNLIDVLANSLKDTVTPGGVAELGSGIINTSSTTVSVVLDTYVVYADGLRQQIFPPTQYTLGPGEGAIQVGFVFVPQQAGIGTATLHADGRITSIEGDPPSPDDRADEDTDTFEVVPSF